MSLSASSALSASGADSESNTDVEDGVTEALIVTPLEGHVGLVSEEAKSMLDSVRRHLAVLVGLFAFVFGAVSMGRAVTVPSLVAYYACLVYDAHEFSD
eukprot:Trichotokara_eunicae@DN5781_c1_g1_i3.p1